MMVEGGGCEAASRDAFGVVIVELTRWKATVKEIPRKWHLNTLLYKL